MNSLGIALVWCAIQVTLVSLITAGVYFAARKLAPTARALAIQTSLLVCVALAALALSPWPQWWSPERGAKAASELTDAETIAKHSGNSQSSGVDGTSSDKSSAHAAARPATSSFDWSEFAATFWETLPRNVATADADAATPKSNWPMYLAYIFLAGVVLALLRVVLGLRSIDACRRVSVPVVEKRILEHLDVVCAELNCRRNVELRESAELATPATTGWRRPVIFLPVEWTDWTDDQCRAVLAHEISHIERNDFLTTVCARLGVALHFYHPLVHWLMRRLTLEQELAADADAARVAGGQRTYLTILAEMALLQANRPVPWAARTFLPTRGMFLRRIEMLRDSKPLSRSASPGLRIAAVGVLLAAGLLAAGFRAPGERRSNSELLADEAISPIVLAAADEAAETDRAATSKGIDLRYVPSDVFALVAVRPSEVLSRDELAPLVSLLDNANLKNLLGTSVTDVEQVTVAMLGDGFINGPLSKLGPAAAQVIIVRMKEPSEFKSLIANFRLDKATSRQSGGEEIFVNTNHPGIPNAYFRPDDRTIVLTHDSAIERIFSAKSSTNVGIFAGANWEKVKKAPVALILNTQFVSTLTPTAPPLQGMVSPIFEQTNSISASVVLEPNPTVAFFADCKSPEGADKVKATVEALMVLAANSLESIQIPAHVPAEERQKVTDLYLKPAKSVLKTIRVEREGSVVSLRAELSPDSFSLATLIQTLQPAISSSREAARRTQSKNNLRRIGLAMHNYHDVHNCFPPAVVMGGKDGKTPHSWRVELLPYLDMKPLYDAYNMDEPWDSEHNKQLLAQMPPVFRHPEDTRGEPYSSYYVFIGEGTIFDGSEGTKIQQITDGMSNTIAAVEANRDIPWTKPEDIPFDMEKDVPGLGGFSGDGYNVLMSDGAVRFVSKTLDMKTLKALIGKADGKAVEIPEQPVQQTPAESLRRTAVPATPAPAKPAPAVKKR